MAHGEQKLSYIKTLYRSIQLTRLQLHVTFVLGILLLRTAKLDTGNTPGESLKMHIICDIR